MNSVRGELLRKSVHVGMGGFALALRWLAPWQAMICAGVALLFNLAVLHRLTRKSLLRESERDAGFSLGIVLYPAAVLALLVVFRNRLELAAATWGLIAFGDGMASVVGVTARGPKLPWNPGKTWSGFLAFVGWGTAAAAFLIRWVQIGALEAPVTWIGPSFLEVGAHGPFFSSNVLLGGCFAATLLAAFAESLPTGIDDNILVPLVGGAALYTATVVDPELLLAAWPSIAQQALIGGAINLALAVGAFAARGVGLSGAISGWCLGTALYAFGGWRAFLLLFVFFVLGTACTKIGYAKKAALGIAQERGGRRGAKNAFANTTAGVVFAFLAVATPWPALFTVALCAAFATAAADTVSSEIGQAFGRTTYLITSFKRVPPGTDGAVSLEGTLAGIAASAVVAAAALATGLLAPTGAAIVVAAAFIGTTLESYLGATLERVKAVDNEVVNFANTLAGGLAAMGIWALM
ncbi:MAG TPA: DUF92 domain-containing protein [Candidatus Polarisedimenticolaceae bacterium]|nr:DUF92 domain-containing protein [Candidatus Polarisedimenticolaceae bacterium]